MHEPTWCEANIWRLPAGPWVCDYHDQVADLAAFGAANEEPLLQLLYGFFHYWAFQHDYNSGVISIRQLRRITKHDKDW